ncbi:hypothetical protein ACFQZZ_07875 [Nocardia sp. GCM10030253]|uniref:hypothetical protein n=1 Tax=Nocardia sp. GCM10030253 TaxID=3273404 RepID=UPI003644DBDC
MRRDRLRTTESADGRKVAIWRLVHSHVRILRVQNRADASPAYRWPGKEQLPAATPGWVLFEVHSRRSELASSVAALLAVFNEDTARKLAVAPDSGHAVVHYADGTVCEVDEDGWPADYDDSCPFRTNVASARAGELR